MKTVDKKVRGKVEVLERHRTLKGYVFRAGQVVEYYTIVDIKEDCGCGRPATFYKFYQTKFGLLPTSKGKIV